MYTAESIASVARIMEECGCNPERALEIQSGRLESIIEAQLVSNNMRPIMITGSPEHGITILFGRS